MVVKSRILILLPLLWAATQNDAFSQTQNENALISGQYTFYLTGQEASSSSSATALVGIAGSFHADGQGHITSGVLDKNSASGAVLGQSITGTYQLDSTGKGSVTLSGPTGSAGFSFYSPLAVSSSNQTFTIVAGTGTLQSASGRLNSSFAITPYNGQGPIPLNLATQAAPGQTEDFGSALLTFSPASPGQVTAQGTETVHDAAPQSFSASGGAYTAPDTATGRFTMTLNGLGAGSSSPQNYVAYQSGQSIFQFFFLSTDPVPTYPLVIGSPLQ